MTGAYERREVSEADGWTQMDVEDMKPDHEQMSGRSAGDLRPEVEGQLTGRSPEEELSLPEELIR